MNSWQKNHYGIFLNLVCKSFNFIEKKTAIQKFIQRDISIRQGAIIYSLSETYPYEYFVTILSENNTQANL